MENNKPKKTGWWIANTIILVLSVAVGPIAVFLFFGVLGLSEYFFIALLILFILIPVFFNINRKSGKCRIALWAARIAFVLTAALFAFIPFVGLGFEQVKLFYVPKKLVYTYGVYSSPYTITEMLPKHLPDDCRDYKMRTQLCMIAQDYHPSAYLMFYTDSDTLAEYEEFFNELPNCEKSYETESRTLSVGEKGKYLNITYILPKAFPSHAFTWLDDMHKDIILDMRNTVVYSKTDTYYSRGCLLDYDSGLVVFWT